MRADSGGVRDVLTPDGDIKEYFPFPLVAAQGEGVEPPRTASASGY
jgi:hypothetical protein